MNLHTASQQWATRPPEQRFWTIGELQTAAQRIKDRSAETEALPYGNLRLLPDGSDLAIENRQTGNRATLTHFSFEQLAQYIKAPADYLRSLSPGTAAAAVNEGLIQAEERRCVLLIDRNGQDRIRAVTSERYGRIWNADIVSRLQPLQDDGWRVPPARPSGQPGERTRTATEADCLRSASRIGLGIKPGETIAPAGLYASDRDMFAFLVNEEREIGGKGLFRGFFVENSEVGDNRAFKITCFLYNAVCGNHIVWDAENVNEVRVVHLGDRAGGRAFDGIRLELKRYADSSSSEDAARIEQARTYLLGEKPEDVIAKLFAAKLTTKANLEAASKAAEAHPEDHGDADPRSAWAFANGLTRLSQDAQYAACRVDLDRAAGRVLKMAW